MKERERRQVNVLRTCRRDRCPVAVTGSLAARCSSADFPEPNLPNPGVADFEAVDGALVVPYEPKKAAVGKVRVAKRRPQSAVARLLPRSAQ